MNKSSSRDGSVVKSAYSTCRGPKYNFLLPEAVQNCLELMFQGSQMSLDSVGI